MIGIVEFVSQTTINIIHYLGYPGIFIAMTLESICIPIPSEIIMPFAGFEVFKGNMTLWGITIAGALGNLAGSIIAYFVGLKGGRPLLEKYGKYILLSHKSLDRADQWFEKYGPEVVFISRFLPGIRTFISLPAGIAEMDVKKFSIYTLAGSLPWAFALGYIGVLLGPEWDTIKSYFHIMDIIVVIAVMLVVIYLVYKSRGKSQTS